MEIIGKSPKLEINDNNSDQVSGKRLAIIINNGIFDGYDKDRYGTGADLIYITSKLLELSYEFIFKYNAKGSEIEEFFERFTSDASIKSYDSVIVLILTHGGTNVIYGIDDIPVRIEKIFELFSDNRCPHLRGKPKVFMINACRGSKSFNHILYS